MAMSFLWHAVFLHGLVLLSIASSSSEVANDNCKRPNQTRIILWAPMRSGSSALSRAFAQRSDTLVLFEPFTSVYYLGPEREHPRHMDLPPDPEHTFEKVWAKLLSPPAGQPVSFAKDFAITLPRVWWKSSRMAEVRHTFLIRHPAPAMASMLRACDDPGSTGYSYFNETEMGFGELAAMFEHVTHHLHQEPLVIEHDDLVEQPEAVLREFMGKLGLDFDERMLTWTTPLPQHPEIWAGFFEHANTSTGFKTSGRRADHSATKSPPKIADAVERAMPAYNLLKAHRLQI